MVDQVPATAIGHDRRRLGRRRGMGGPLLRAAVTYENTTRDFAAGVLAADAQGFRIIYHSLTSDARRVGIVPWDLEGGGTYRLRYGIDENEDDKIDQLVEEREFVFPQPGTPIYIKVEPRTSYVVVDPDDDIKDEINTFNNVAHAELPRPEKEEPKPVPKPAGRGFRRGRR